MGEWLKTPLGLVTLLAVVEAGVLAWLYQSRRRAALVAALAVPVIGAAVILIDVLQVSATERVDRAIQAVRRGVLAGDAEAVLAHVDPAYEFQDLSYDQLAAWLRAVLAAVRIERAQVVRREFTTVSSSRIRVRVEATATAQGLSRGPVRSTWSLTFVPLDGRWVIAEVDPIEVAGRRVDSVRDLP